MKVCAYVRRGRVVVRWIPTDRNWADIFTKLFAEDKFYTFWKQMCGYEPWPMPDEATAATGATQIEFTRWQEDQVL